MAAVGIGSGKGVWMAEGCGVGREPQAWRLTEGSPWDSLGHRVSMGG